MGIRGLETFIDKIYHSQDRNQIFEEMKLNEIKLIIDGNQFCYVLSTIFEQGQYGGNYDLFYNKSKTLLSLLAPSIEIIIFDGAKESIEKSKYRLKQKISRISNINIEENIMNKENCLNKISQQAHLQVLKEFPSLFNRLIIYEILNELNINYSMCEGMADHVIALYANGHNPNKQKYTVMSKASFFNVYNLENGYLSTKYVCEAFKNVDKLDLSNTLFPIFYLKKVTKYFCLESQKTWIYFCILCGNNDDVELKRNINYFKEYNIDTRGGDLNHLIAHCKIEETKLIETNFRQIRNTYQIKRENALKKIDELINLFEMKNNKYKFLESFNKEHYLNDFDRLFSTLQNLNCFFINCFVEDCFNEESIFQPSIQFIRMIYSVLWSKSQVKYAQIDEIIRAKNPTRDTLFNVSSITSEQFNKFIIDNKYLNFITDVNNKMKSLNLRDDLTLIFVSLIVWENWMDKTLIKYENYGLKSIDFVDSVLINFVILTFKFYQKDNLTHNYEANDLTQACLANQLIKTLTCSISDLNKIFDFYDSICSKLSSEENFKEYFEIDLKLVHRLNEFQAIYYTLGALNKINDFKFDYLLPHKFLNCYFCVDYLKQIKTDPNNNEENQFFVLFKSNKLTFKLFSILKEKFNFCKRIINRTNLNDLLCKNLKLEK